MREHRTTRLRVPAKPPVDAAFERDWNVAFNAAYEAVSCLRESTAGPLPDDFNPTDDPMFDAVFDAAFDAVLEARFAAS